MKKWNYKLTNQTGTKLCWNCKTIKSTLDFRKAKDRKDGFRATCKICDTTLAMARQFSIPVIFSRYKFQAKKRNLPFNLSKDEFITFWGKNCFYCGEQIKYVGIDRVDNCLGYSIDNCVACCGECNKMKSWIDINSSKSLIKLLKLSRKLYSINKNRHGTNTTRNYSRGGDTN